MVVPAPGLPADSMCSTSGIMAISAQPEVLQQVCQLYLKYNISDVKKKKKNTTNNINNNKINRIPDLVSLAVLVMFRTLSLAVLMIHSWLVTEIR